MYGKLVELYSLLTARQRKRFLLIQLLVIAMALLEVISIMSVGSFMGLVADPGKVESSLYLETIYQWSGAKNPNSFLLIIGAISIILLTIAAAVSMITVWLLSIYGVHVGSELGSRLFNHYMAQPWLFHANENSSKLVSNISHECARISNGIIQPFLYLNAKLVLALVMSTAIFLYNPKIALTAVAFFAGAYFTLYTIIKHRLSRYGAIISNAQTERMRALSEGFGGVKDAILLDRRKSFALRFDVASRQMADATAKIQVFSQVPRYAMEFLAYTTVIVLVIFLLLENDNELALVLPTLTVYALAGLKLLPSFQQIYTSTSSIRSHLSAFELIKDGLNSETHTEHDRDGRDGRDGRDDEIIQFSGTIRQYLALSDIVFQYPTSSQKALDGVSVKIDANTVVGFAGKSGGGKSTLVDILLGLLQPNSGSLTVDGQLVGPSNVRQWQRNIAFVPQQIYLADATIKRNIAFGLEEEEIDIEKVRRAITLASLEEVVNGLESGMDTTVGERGVQLSGGQRQRIGIARALYDDCNLLVFDEATSALDGINEKFIMETIKDFSGKKTIVLIAHRLTTLKNCDVIYLLEDGKIYDSGSFSELEIRNPGFFSTLENDVATGDHPSDLV